ncbi:hypothetical protein [Flectobacillus sp. BAB-3569]|uniref:hypothetical protein n=1 Tax=Flectobacillus sp. BAB-3569 TaxID=1509483 RepID=UPI000BA45648|nr:hypothetical protein [Flectobacillus sp. BAB-3569]PAC27814.1 hypothetical protein BWI92_21620 [Flectobacillus sp. BAB-3569]
MERLNIEDFSYSGLVDLIQGDTEVAGDVLYDLAFQLKELNEEIDELEKKLKSAARQKAELYAASLRVLKHINKEVPISVAREKVIIQVFDSGYLEINNNVI